MSVYEFNIQTPIGEMMGLMDSGQLLFLKFKDSIDWQQINQRFPNRQPMTEYHGIQKQVDEYFAGKRNKFDLSIKLKGTVFQTRVWQIISQLDYGEPVNYQWLADKINASKSTRAVGNAVGANPIHLIIPCHRVIRSDGLIGGYAGGVERKKFLLQLERKTNGRTISR